MSTGTQEATDEKPAKVKKTKGKADKASKKAANGTEKAAEGKKVKAKGDKANGKVKAKGKPEKAAKADKGKKGAKPEKAAKGKKSEKTAKPKKEKATVARDKFGFKEGSLKSQAAALYSNKKTKGATLNEIKEATGSSLLNLLKELDEKGFTITKTKEPGTGKKQVTRYFIKQ